MAELDPGVVGSVINSNFKTNGEFGTRFAMSLAEDFRIAGKQATDNLIQSSNRFNSAMDTAVLRAVKGLVEPDMEESISSVKMDTGYDKASQGMNLGAIIAQLSAAVSAIQQYTKTAQTTPPVTHG